MISSSLKRIVIEKETHARSDRRYKIKKNVIPVYREIVLVTIMLFWVIYGREYLAIPTEESSAVISSKCYVMIIWPSHALVNHF